MLTRLLKKLRLRKERASQYQKRNPQQTKIPEGYLSRAKSSRREMKKRSPRRRRWVLRNRQDHEGLVLSRRPATRVCVLKKKKIHFFDVQTTTVCTSEVVDWTRLDKEFVLEGRVAFLENVVEKAFF